MTVMRNAVTLSTLLVLLACSTEAQQANRSPGDQDVAARIGDRAITVKELWYRAGDMTCCPTGVALTTWWLRDGTLTADPAVQVS